MFAGEPLAFSQNRMMPAAILASVFIAREQQSIGDNNTKAAGDTNIMDQANDQGIRDLKALGAEGHASLCFHDLSFVLEHKENRPPDRNKCQGLSAGVQDQRFCQLGSPRDEPAKPPALYPLTENFRKEKAPERALLFFHVGDYEINGLPVDQ